jgi:predicted metal-dependent peptidase
VTQETAEHKLKRARAWLIMRQPFFGTLALHLRLVEAQAPAVTTMAVDGTNLFWNRGFVDSLPAPELQGVVAHEVLHCANKHHTRRQQRNPDKWNEACDYAINADLKRAGFRLPGGLYDPAYAGMNAEAIFALREKQAQQQQQQQQQKGGGGQQQSAGAGQQQPGGQPSSRASKQGQPGQSGQPGGGGQQPGQQCNDPGRCGGVIDAAPAHEAAALQRCEAEWNERVRQAIAVAKSQGAGKIPAGLESIVEALNKPRVDWRAMLRRFVDDAASKDYSWQRPNRRYFGLGHILPGFVPDRPSHIVPIIDTSGSMSDEELAAFATELQSAMDDGAADKITVVYADTKVHRHESFAPGDIVKLGAKGRGGTAFREPLQWVADNLPDASALLYMTDMDSSDYGDEPLPALMWIVTGDPRTARAHASRAPFGETVILADC